MKELLGHASNLILVPVLHAPPQVKARIELIVICSEPTYTYGLDGFKNERTVSEFRVLCGHKDLREMAKQLIALADEAEDLEKTMNEATAAAVGAA
jgi:hypothetical protein